MDVKSMFFTDEFTILRQRNGGMLLVLVCD